jgi:hypothetical protein
MNDIKISKTYKLNIKNQEIDLTQDEAYALYKQLSNALGLCEPVSAPLDDAIKKPYVSYNPYDNGYWNYPFQTWCHNTKL